MVERPKLRGTDEPFAPRLLGIGVTRTKALEPLVRGLPVRDVGAALEEAMGEQAARPLHRSARPLGRPELRATG